MRTGNVFIIICENNGGANLYLEEGASVCAAMEWTVSDPNLPPAGVGFRAFQLAHDLIDPRAAPAAWDVIPVELG
jgi:hypothetical protein